MFEKIAKIEDNSSLYTYKYDNNALLKQFEDKKCINILCGQVQSGKTAKIIEIIKCAFKDFNYDYVFYLSGTITKLKEQSDERLKKIADRNICRLYFDIEDLDYTNPMNPPCLFSILKQKDWLFKMETFIADNHNKKILIIDDECDICTVNTNDIDEDKTTINKSISNSYKAIIHGGLLLVSATPFANIVNTKSFDEDIKYIWLMDVNPNYTGLKFFNDLDKNFYTPINGNNKDKIKKSLFIWLIKTYLYFKEQPLNNDDKKSQFIIYMNSKNDLHESYKCTLIGILNDNNFKNDLFKFIEKDYPNIDINGFDQFLNDYQIPNKLINCIYILNQNNNPEINTDLQILIGGNYFSRGITYQYLITELLTLDNNGEFCIDTWLQRARWFGYRKKNNQYKYMNLICDNYLINKYKDTYQNIEEFINPSGGCLLLDDNLRNKLQKKEGLNSTNAYKRK